LKTYPPELKLVPLIYNSEIDETTKRHIPDICKQYLNHQQNGDTIILNCKHCKNITLTDSCSYCIFMNLDAISLHGYDKLIHNILHI
jgi:hypothetical protein